MAMKVVTANLNPVRILEALLLLVLLAVLVRAVMPWLSQQQTVVSPLTSAKNIAVPEIDNFVLKTFDPFHRDTPPIAVNVIEISRETTLDLKVFGMRANINGDTSSAIIQTPDRKQAIYFLGDEIIPGVTLKQVEIDYVILDRNHVAERLSRQGKAEGDARINDTITMAVKAQE